MEMWTVILVGLCTCGIAWVTIPFLIANFGHVTGRKQFHHTSNRPVLRWGGLALIACFWVVAIGYLVFFPVGEYLKLYWTVIGTASAMFAVGFWDDLRPLGAKRKLLAQLVISIAAWYGGLEVTKLTNIFTGQSFDAGLLSAPVTVLWLVLLTNLINLIDGIDGLAGGICFMLFLLLSYAGWRSELAFPTICAAALCGALTAFLRFNFPPARIYLGDGGAYFLGFLIGLLSIVSSHKGTVTAALVAPAFALALPIIDVAVAILRRGSKGLPLFRADKKHIHHRLQEMGFSRRTTVLVLYSVSLLFLIAAFSVFVLQQRWLPLIFGMTCLIVLLIARSFRFSREWLSVGRAFGNSLELRKDTQYALLFCRWMEMESERAPDVETLWSDFKVIIRKVGFTRVELHVDGSVFCWSAPSQPGVIDEIREFRYDIREFSGMTLNFQAHSEVMHPKKFELMCELMAEAWVKSITRWQEIHGRPVSMVHSEPVRAPKTPPLPAPSFT